MNMNKNTLIKIGAVLLAVVCVFLIFGNRTPSRIKKEVRLFAAHMTVDGDVKNVKVQYKTTIKNDGEKGKLYLVSAKFKGDNIFEGEYGLFYVIKYEDKYFVDILDILKSKSLIKHEVKEFKKELKSMPDDVIDWDNLRNG